MNLKLGSLFNQESIGLLDGGDNFYKFAVNNAQGSIDPLDLSRNRLAAVEKHHQK